MMVCEFCLGEGEGNEEKLRSGKCYTHCQESEDGKHEADPGTFHLERDRNKVYLDVNCRNCGQSGCVGKFDAEEVLWD
jgi:hypothetical protein